MKNTDFPSTTYGIAIDVGTTTMAMSLILRDSGEELARTAFVNPQAKAALGSDVLSRMKLAAYPAGAERLGGLVRDTIAEHTKELLREADIKEGIDKIREDLLYVIAGNTAMLHLLFGLPVAGMLSAPFTPADISMRREELFGIPAIIFPCASAFIGGDIIAGVYALAMERENTPVLFVDLGTNGEMVLCREGELYATSVAAGPAFEGGNISIGMAAAEGAIRQVKIHNGFCRVMTIGDAPARGICGSGLLSAVYELYREGLADQHGTLVDSYINEGFPLYATDVSHKLLLTQDDIRAFLTAKAAVAAGMRCLAAAADIGMEDIARLSIAGSFGEYIDLAAAAGTGLIPPMLSDKVTAAGNTSLRGAKKLLVHPEDAKQSEAVAAKLQTVSLADDAAFRRMFIEEMDLPAQFS